MSGILSNIYVNTNYALHLHTEAMARLQEQISTGSRINRASDDPSAAYRILDLNSQERSLENYIDNLSEVVSTLEFSYAAIDSMKSAISRITLRLSGISGISGASGIAEEINTWLEDIVSSANTKYTTGRYLFGGSDTASAPYLVERTNGKITSVTYQGSLEDRKIEVAPGVKVSTFYAGDDMFHSDNRSTPIFPGATGAAAGTGTSNVSGDIWLTVTYNDVSGKYELSIDDEVDPVVVEGDITNLAVTNSAGQVLYVNATNIDSTGTDWVRVPGTYDIFNALITIRDRLETPGGLDTAQLEELRSNGLQSLEEINNLLIDKSVSVGSKIGFLEDIKDGLTKQKYDSEDEVTRLAEADIAQIAIDLSRREILYQMSLSMAARLLSISLLDFIR